MKFYFYKKTKYFKYILFSSSKRNGDGRKKVSFIEQAKKRTDCYRLACYIMNIDLMLISVLHQVYMIMSYIRPILDIHACIRPVSDIHAHIRPV